MIFNIHDHIQQIIRGIKTQTRRESNRYKIKRSYAIQRCRTCKGIPEGRIIIVQKRKELPNTIIGSYDATMEGNYSPIKFEKLYTELHPKWKTRYAYTFIFMPTKEK